MDCIVCAEPPDLLGVKVYDACQFSEGQPCPPCRQYLEVGAQMLVWKETLAKALMRQCELRREINDQHDLMRRLPSDIVLAIFKYFTTIDTEVFRSSWGDKYADTGSLFSYGYNGHENEAKLWETSNWCSALTLGAVCTTWRRITWTSPQLWTNIDIRLTRPKDWNSIEIAQEYLSRSKGFPLSIRLWCDLPSEPGRKDDRKAFLRFISLFNQCSSRWEDLYLYCTRELIPLILGDSHGAPILRKLSLGQPLYLAARRPDKIRFSITDIKPRPSHVSIMRRGIKSLDIDWSRVTKVDFSSSTWVNFGECIELLREAPQLVDLRIPRIRDADHTYQFPAPDFPIPLKLENFLIGNYIRKKLGSFLDVFVFPYLTHLALGRVGAIALGHFADMIRRSSCHILSLRLHDMAYGTETLRLIRETPFLQEIHLFGSGTSHLQLHRLFANTFTSDVVDSAVQPRALPNLQLIHYHDTGYFRWDDSFWNSIPDILGRPLNFHDSQRRLLCKMTSNASKSYKDEPLICKDRDVLIRLVKLLESGMKITLEDGGGTDLIETSMRHHGITATRCQEGDSLQNVVS